MATGFAIGGQPKQSFTSKHFTGTFHIVSTTKNKHKKMATTAANLAFVGPYSADAYNAAAQISNGQTGVPYNPATIQAANTIVANQPSAAPQVEGLNTGGTTDNSTSGYTLGVNDPATLAAYNQAIANTQSAINRTPNELASGYSGIDASFQNALNQLLLGKNQANTAYTGQKQTTALDYSGAKNTIGANAGTTLNGLLRLLGSRGAGGSLAATGTGAGTLRGEVGRSATLQRSDVSNQNASNNQLLDTNWNNYLTGYNNEVSSANNQRDTQRQSLEQSVNNNKASLLQTLAQLQAESAAATGGNAVAAAQPSLDQANSLLDSLSNYTVAPITYNTQAYQPASLASYNTDSNATPQVNNQSGSLDYFSPYLSALLGKKQPSVA